MLLAKAYCKLGDRTEAAFYLQQAAQLSKDDPYHDASTNALLHSIVAELYLMQGDAANAEAMYAQFCARMERLYGTDHVATSDCYNLVSAFYTHQANYARAIEFCGRALVIRIETLGPTHRCTADSHYNLGLLYRLSGDLHEALREFRFARDVRTRIFGARSCEVAEVDISVGFTEHQLGNMQHAHDHYERAFLARYPLLGPRHADTAEALDLLNAVRREQRRPPYVLTEEMRQESTRRRSAKLVQYSGSESVKRRRRRPAGVHHETFDLLLLRRAISEVNRTAVAKGALPPIDTEVQAQIERIAQTGPLTSSRLRALFGARYPRATHLLLAQLIGSHGWGKTPASEPHRSSNTDENTRVVRSLFAGGASQVRANSHKSAQVSSASGNKSGLPVDESLMATANGKKKKKKKKKKCEPRREKNRGNGDETHLGGPGGPGASSAVFEREFSQDDGLGTIGVKELNDAINGVNAAASTDSSFTENIVSQDLRGAMVAFCGSFTNESALRSHFSQQAAVLERVLEHVRMQRHNHSSHVEASTGTSTITSQLLHRHPSWIATMSEDEKQMLGILGDPSFPTVRVEESLATRNSGNGQSESSVGNGPGAGGGSDDRNNIAPPPALPFEGLVGMPSSTEGISSKVEGGVATHSSTPGSKDGRRTYVVEFTGKELWELVAPKVKSLGIFPMFIRQRADIEARKKREAEMATKRAKTDAVANESDVAVSTVEVPTSAGGSSPEAKDYGPKSGMRQIHWDVLDSTEGTIWASAADDEFPLDDIIGDLKAEFTTKPRGTKEVKKKAKPTEAVLIPDPKRRQNFSIFVKTLTKGSRSMDDVAKFLLTMDEGAFGPNALASFEEFVPEPGETGAVEEYVSSGGDLSIMGPAERFVMAIADVPRVKERVQSMRFKMLFDEQVADAEAQADIIQKCCEQVHESKRLGPILSLILKVGNKMNAGTAKGQAQGIKLTSLMKLTQTKTNTGHSLLEFLVENMRSKDNLKDLLQVSEDFPTLSEATRVNFPTLNADMNKLRSAIRRVDNTMDKAEEDDPHYAQSMGPFIDRAKIKFEVLEERFNEMKDSFKDVCVFLGENPQRVKPDELFSQLERFVSALRSTVSRIEAIAERKRRQAQRESEKEKMKEKIAERKRSAMPRVMPNGS